MARYPNCPSVDGIPEAHPRHARDLVRWSLNGYRHGATHGPKHTRAHSRFLLYAGQITSPVLLAVEALLITRRARRTFLAPAGDAVLAVTRTRQGWRIEDHIAEVVGQGRGKALRDLVLAPLVAAADASRVPIYAIAATPTLADLYAAELPGLVVVGRAFPRGLKMRRPPCGERG